MAGPGAAHIGALENGQSLYERHNQGHKIVAGLSTLGKALGRNDDNAWDCYYVQGAAARMLCGAAIQLHLFGYRTFCVTLLALSSWPICYELPAKLLMSVLL